MRGGALKQPGLAACDEASSPPLLYAKRSPPLETGIFPVNARWCSRGSRKGTYRDCHGTRDVSRRTHVLDETTPVRSSAVGPEIDQAAGEATFPRAPGPKRGAHASVGLPPLMWTLPCRTLQPEANQDEVGAPGKINR